MNGSIMVSTVKERKDYIMTNLTNNEQAVLNSIHEICTEDFSADLERISADVNMTIYSVRGVIGSLVKKNRVVCEQEERADRLFYDIFYKDEDGKILSYGDWS